MWFPLILLLLLPASAGAVTSIGCSSEVIQAEKSDYFTWARFSEEWSESVVNAFHEPGELAPTLWRKPLRDPYLIAIARGDTRVRELSTLALTLDRLEQNEVLVRPLTEVIQEFNEGVEGWIKEGRLTKDERLKPGVAVRDENGQIFLLPFGVDRPKCHHVDVSSRPSLFTKMLSLGVAPITSGVRAIHDLNHLRGLRLDPRYMALSRRLAGIYTGKESGLPLRDRYIRFFHWYEGLALFPASARVELTALMTHPTERSRNKVFQIMLQQTPAETVARGRALIDFAYRRLQFFGGAGEIGLSYGNAELEDSLPRMLSQTLRQIDVFAKLTDVEQRARVYPLICSMLAKTEIARWYASVVNLEDYFQGVVQPSTSLETPFGRWFQPSVASVSNHLPLFALSVTGGIDETHDQYFSTQFDSLRD